MSTTWRTDPFQKGRSYRVRKDFCSLRDSFVAGEVLHYRESAYSAYDSQSGFIFADQEGKSRVWDIHDDDPLEVWNELFEAV